MKLNLSKQDIDYIARVAATEVDHSLKKSNPEMYDQMTKGVVDTILNRVASPSFPDSVEGVVNQKRQFSKIAGPKSVKPYGSVQRTPKANKTVESMVSGHIQARASGEPSTIGGNLHYANPHHSTKNNLGWINALDGPKIGKGQRVHYHGTTKGYEPVGELNIALGDDVERINVAGLPQGENIPIPADKPQITLANAEAPTLASVAPTGYASESNAPITPLDRMLGMEEKPQRKGLAALNPSGSIGGELAYSNPGQEIDPSYEIAQVVSGAGQELGRDINVNSGYRSPQYNRDIGGAKNSLHPQKKAMDVSMSGMDRQERQDLVQSLTQRGAGGFITYDKYPDMLHVDMRNRSSEFSPRFMHNKSSRFMDSAPEWYQEMAEKDGVALPKGDRAPLPALGEQAFSDFQNPIAKPFETERTPIEADEFLNAQQPKQAQQQPRQPQAGDYANYQMNERTGPETTPNTQANEFWGLGPAPKEMFQRNNAGLPTDNIPVPQDRYGFVPTPVDRPADLDFREKEEEKDIKKDSRVRGNNFTKYGVTALGNMVGGPVGALAGRMLEERWARGKNINPLSKSQGQNFWDSFMTAKDPIERFAASTMQNAMTGERGATYTASNGSQATSLGNGQYTYYSPKSGKTSINGEINMNQSADLRDFFSGSSKDDEDEE